MKRTLIFAALIAALIAPAWAQRVGDTVQITGSSETWRVESASGDRVTLVKAGGLNGVWDQSGGADNCFTSITFSGDRAVFTAFSARGGAQNWRDAYDKGMIKAGDLILRNIRSTSATTWSCESLDVDYTGSGSRATATGTKWLDGLLTMQADGTIMHTMPAYRNWSQTFRKR